MTDLARGRPGCEPGGLAGASADAAARRAFDWLAVGAVATWLVCGLWPLSVFVRGGFPRPAGLLYAAAFAAFGAALFFVLTLPRRGGASTRAVPITMALVESLAAVGMNALTVRTLGGSGAGVGFVVIVAAQLPYFLAPRIVWIWIAVQTAVLTAIFYPSSALEAVTAGGATAGFQLFAAASSMLVIRERNSRARLARVNAELTATRERLAETSRSAERLRISRDLHDTLGHHLTALSLQLDVASRLTHGKAKEHVTQAHAIARLLLSDVRDVVSTLRETSLPPLGTSLRSLAAQPLGFAIQLTMPDDLPVDGAGQADAIRRAVQEIITNTARHANARALEIALDVTSTAIILVARDDGDGATSVAPGHGLTGMRERIEGLGGSVHVGARAGGGFEVMASLPRERR